MTNSIIEIPEVGVQLPEQPVAQHLHVWQRVQVWGFPGGSPLRGVDITVNVFDINQPSLPTPFYSVLVSVSFLWSFQL